jgi:hypothetical protein
MSPLMAFRFEFDPVNKVLLLRVEGPVSDELVAKAYADLKKYWAATDARACIADLSSATKHGESADFVRDLARREPAMVTRPAIIVAGSTAGYGIARMFQIAREGKREQLHIERTLGAALTALGIESPNFEPLRLE